MSMRSGKEKSDAESEEGQQEKRPEKLCGSYLNDAREASFSQEKLLFLFTFFMKSVKLKQ